MKRTALALAIALVLALPALAADEPEQVGNPGATSEKIEKPAKPEAQEKAEKPEKAVKGAEAEKPKSEFGALKFRAVGPAVTGRVDRVTGVAGDPRTYYAAFAQGGVWKTENGGRNWKPLFDEQSTNS